MRRQKDAIARPQNKTIDTLSLVDEAVQALGILNDPGPIAGKDLRMQARDALGGYRDIVGRESANRHSWLVQYTLADYSAINLNNYPRRRWYLLYSLERLTQTQRRFVADASHELRVPLTTIQGNLTFLQLHQAELTSEERQSVLTEVNDETVRLSRLVQDLLLLARADASETPLVVPEQMKSLSEGSTHQSPLELDRVVLELVRKLRRRLSLEGSTVKLEIGHIEPVRVRGDEENVRRITLILLDNAIKYTPTDDDDSCARVTISLKQMDQMAMLCVQDTGIGIDPADLPHIFERFYRANRARPRQGTGLGLSIAKTLVEQLDGYITAESILGKGSTFKVWLPLL